MLSRNVANIVLLFGMNTSVLWVQYLQVEGTYK